jgi:hypothetical protein
MQGILEEQLHKASDLSPAPGGSDAQAAFMHAPLKNATS